ncbi:hypothetical protein OY671_007645, partial [Metschnikowia pulcherrima]
KSTTSSKDSSGAVNQVAQKYDEVFVGDSPKPRISVGIGVNWNSPFGPFRIDFAKVLSKVEGDDPKAFTFNAMAAAPAAPAATGGVVAAGVAVANPPAIVASSSAYQTAQQQRPVTYKAQIDQANTRKNQITAQLQPSYAKSEADSKAPKPDQAASRQQYAHIQQIEQAGQREIQQISEPSQLSEQYVSEQIGDKSDDATQSAMTKRKISSVLDSQSVIKADQAYNSNQDISTELNASIPSAQLVPPAGWSPRAQRERQAQQQAAQAAAAQPDNKKAPVGR